jgi:glycosyltransferase involved in cell wall biosynthesis
MQKKEKILISTGIYPPQIGGPAQYAKNLKEVFEDRNYEVSVKTFLFERILPGGLRHLFFLFKIIPDVIKSDKIFIFDIFSVALPTVFACKIFGKKSIIRTGGDFLWEQYVERTGRKILLSNFYKTEKRNFSFKEKVVFNLIGWTLRNTSMIIFSTEWQRNIFTGAYGLVREKTSVVENYYGPKEESFNPKEKIFVASSRDLVLKNKSHLKKIFNKIKQQHINADLFIDNLPFSDFIQKIKNSYAVIQISLGDISPNLILDAIRFNKPFICTKEVGIFERIKDMGIFVDPLNEKEIEEAILLMLNDDNYKLEVEKVRNFSFIHTWENIADEFINIFNSIK